MICILKCGSLEMCISGPSWCYVQHNKSGIILNLLRFRALLFLVPTSFQKKFKYQRISKLHVQKFFSKTLGTCHARLDTFPRGIWIPSASLSMASFTFKLQHFNVMLSLGLLTHSLSTFGLNQSQGGRNIWGQEGGSSSPNFDNYCPSWHGIYSFDPKVFLFSQKVFIDFFDLSLPNLKTFRRQWATARGLASAP